jgi:hypothetical protein
MEFCRENGRRKLEHRHHREAVAVMRPAGFP